MKRLISAIALSGLAAFAQHVPVLNPSRGMTPPAGASPYGNILFPGGLPVNQSHASRLGRSVAGGGYPGVLPGNVGPSHGGQIGRPRTIVVPYAVPLYYGDYGYGYQQQQQPAASNITVVVPQQPAPNIIINNTYAPDSSRPVLQAYSGSDSAGPGMQVFEGPKSATEAPKPTADTRPQVRMSDRPTLYLIALKDTTVRQAIGYWVEDATLHYVTPQGSINRVTLDQVDRETSEQLNSERKLDLDLSGKR